MRFVLRQRLKLMAASMALSASLWPLMSTAQNASTAKVLEPFSLTDDRGRVVVIDKAPRRIVTLLPSLGEIVCELQACERLVGVDRYSNWPERVKSLPKLGGIDDTQLEALVQT
jgi:iron complex transport system substrate-binding protein